MNHYRFCNLFGRFLVVSLLLLGTGVVQAVAPAEERAKIRQQSAEVLQRLYKASPNARQAVESAAGYATFRNFGLKVGVAGSGKGKGLAVLSRSGETTFMKFVELQAGIGMGVKKYDLVFVFETEKAASDFVSKGWQYGTQATAAVKHKSRGKAFEGAVSISPGIWLYQLTSSGLSAELTFKSTKYFPDKKLNEPDTATGESAEVK